MSRLLITSLLTLWSTAAAPALFAQEATATAPPGDFVVTDAYPVDACVVTGRALAAGPIFTVEADGRTFRVCTEACTLVVQAGPDPYSSKLDEAVIATQKPTYPLDTCAVTGEPLSSFERPAELVLGNRLILVGDAKFARAAKAERTQIIEKITTAVHREQRPDYVRLTDIVTGETLGAEAIDVVHGTTLVRLANQASLALFQRNPARYARELGYATATAIMPSACCGACAMEAAPKTKPASKAPAGCCADQPKAPPKATGCCADKPKAPPKATGCCADKPKAPPKATGCCADKSSG